MNSDFLPPGCTDEDCEGYNPICQGCGCKSDMHYMNEDNYELNLHTCDRDLDPEYMNIEYNAKGKVVHACDSLINGKQCECKEFEE